jgi:hypothetical protein
MAGPGIASSSVAERRRESAECWRWSGEGGGVQQAIWGFQATGSVTTFNDEPAGEEKKSEHGGLSRQLVKHVEALMERSKAKYFQVSDARASSVVLSLGCDPHPKHVRRHTS